jgi:predicted dehydrogenase
VPYNKNRTFYRFRWFYDYSGGQLTNFGVHYLAQIHWALGVEAPLAVVAMGGKFADYDNREVPDTLEVLWHYPGDTLVTFSQFNATARPGRPAVRDRVPRHQGDAVLPHQRLRGRAGGDHAQRVRRPHAAGPEP